MARLERATRAWARRGFTLIELLVVMAIVATLLSVALPRYFKSVEKSREAVLRQDLATVRDAIDKHFADTGKYPASLEELVTRRYIRKMPVDPFTESAGSWVVVPPPGAAADKGGVYDVKSGAQGKALDGSSYSEW